jgi:hypothetical protein
MPGGAGMKILIVETDEYEEPTVVDVEKWAREHVQDIDFDVQPGERECLAYASMLMYKMFLLGRSGTYKFSKGFRKLINELPKELKGLLR